MQAPGFPSPRRESRPVRASLPAVLLTLLAVAGAIVFGIYGPPVAGRSGLGGAVPVGEVVDAVAEHVVQAIQADRGSQETTDLALEEARGLLQRHLGRPARAPDLTEVGYGLRQVMPLSVPGAAYRAAGLLYRGQGEQQGRWAMLLLCADDGQYLTFDSLGRPHPMVPDTTFDGELAAHEDAPTAALVWTDGRLLHVACVEDDDEAERLRDALGAP